MKKLKKDSDTPLFVPDFVAKSVEDIDFDTLRKLGVRFVAFDADSTLVPSREKIIPKESAQLLKAKLSKFEGACIASNRITNDLDGIAESLNVKVIRATWSIRKPSKDFFRRVIDHFKADPAQIAMIGDKLVADIYGGNRMGLVTVWVEKLGEDNVLDRIFRTRKLEARMMKRYM